MVAVGGFLFDTTASVQVLYHQWQKKKTHVNTTCTCTCNCGDEDERYNMKCVM